MSAANEKLLACIRVQQYICAPLIGAGVIDRENARICGVSIRAIRHWRAGDRRADRVEPGTSSKPTCPHCHGRARDDAAYAYPLGLYRERPLTRGPRSHVLWLACSDAWPGLLDLGKQTMSLVMPSSSVFCASRTGVGCTYVKSVSRHWPCLLPQHGPGRKHERKIDQCPGSKRSWPGIQEASPAASSIPMAAASSITFAARSRTGIAGMKYPRYLFVNRSADIHRLCGERWTGSAWPGDSSRPPSPSPAVKPWPGWTSSSARNMR